MVLIYFVYSYFNWVQPYLHESRHRHALNRVRGSGGRFLSTKQLAQSNTEFVTGAHPGSGPTNKYQKEYPSEVESHHHSSKIGDNASSIATCSDRTYFSGNSVNFRQPELMFLGNSSNIGGGAPQCSGGGLTFGGAKQRASVVRWEMEIYFIGQANHPWLSHFGFCVFMVIDYTLFSTLACSWKLVFYIVRLSSVH